MLVKSSTPSRTSAASESSFIVSFPSWNFFCNPVTIFWAGCLCRFFCDLPNPFLQVGILDILANTLPAQDTNVVATEPSHNVRPHLGSPDGLPFFKLRIESAVLWRDIICRNSTGPPTIHMHHAVPRAQSTSHHVDAWSTSHPRKNMSTLLVELMLPFWQASLVLSSKNLEETTKSFPDHLLLFHLTIITASLSPPVVQLFFVPPL